MTLYLSCLYAFGFTHLYCISFLLLSCCISCISFFSALFAFLILCTSTHSFKVAPLATVITCFTICWALSQLKCHSTVHAPLCVPLCGVAVCHFIYCSGSVFHFILPIMLDSSLSFRLSNMALWDLCASVCFAKC